MNLDHESVSQLPLQARLTAYRCKENAGTRIACRLQPSPNDTSVLASITLDYATLWLADLYRVPIRIVKAEDPLPPFLFFDRVDQFNMRRDICESRINILMFEIQKQVSLPIGLGGIDILPPDRLFKRPAFMDREARLEENKISEVFHDLQAESLVVELL
jgi:hypothetical protein